MTPRSQVQLIDLELEGVTGVVTTYVLPAGDGFVIIDPGPTSCLAGLEHSLARLGHTWDQLYAVLLTHIHLDHAGAAGIIAERSGAPVFVHPQGADHLRDPQRLVASATRLWGENVVKRLWGEIRPVDEHQVAPVSDGQELSIGGLHLRALHSPGHARHHMVWQLDNSVFCGDIAGVSLSGSTRVFAPVPPPELDFEAWRSSIEMIESLGAETLWLSHFGPVVSIAAHLGDLRRELDDLESLALGHRDDLQAAMERRRQAFEGSLPEALRSRLELANPTLIDVGGLQRWLRVGATVGQV